MSNISVFHPRSEHERHSPNCPFVKGEHTQNVPLSVTLATSPAQFPNGPDTSDKITCFGFGSCPQFLAAATKRGKICIWDISKIMKVRTSQSTSETAFSVLCFIQLLVQKERLIIFADQVHLKFDINPYDPIILRKLVLSGGEQNQQALAESRRPILAWIEESSSCSDLPKLEGDR